ncbi:hypothetical protein N3K66_007633 [Trichothecium roseum]|uniref:Uncharacterized protein n=1 Tax=Trichothecium roseum TaxID=47278 RepID=A0ACC0UW85_9HYPO|nr:hypothetical protein N3K66_007633 [Trichothecium roseum]
MPAVKGLDILDIRGDMPEMDLKEQVASMLKQSPRMLPTMLVYNDKGLQLFEEITYLDEYYLTNHEINVLERSAAEMARKIPNGAVVVELGSGNLRKIQLLLQAFEDAEKSIDYYALDLDYSELQRTLAQLPAFDHVQCHGLWGTYDDGKKWLEEGDDSKPKCVMHMGSSIGNFTQSEASDFLAQFANVMRPQDMLLLGVDACEKPEKVYHAYNDSKGVTHQFILNGLAHANSIFKKDVFTLEDWRVIGEYVYDHPSGGRHQAFVSPTRDVVVLDQHIKANERIQIEQSQKYSPTGLANLLRGAGLAEVQAWQTYDLEYGIHLLQRTSMPFPSQPSLYASSHIPTPSDWHSLWQAWDVVTRRMLPEQELGDKPIRLRNACVFYLGHIPAFLDIQLSKVTGEPRTKPEYFASIFERGIDPDVDDPQKCHDHSEVPKEWPPVDEILRYQDAVRARLLSFYESDIPRTVARAVWLGFEHEVMHIETLLYMLIQSDKTLPPPHVEVPDFERLAREAKKMRAENKWFNIPAQTINIGLDDPENDLESKGHFGWDNEKPARQVQVHAFKAKGRPITNGEYAQYMHANHILSIPASWKFTKSSPSRPDSAVDVALQSPSTTTPGEDSQPLPPDSFLDGKSVRTVHGLVPLTQALDWPVSASYDELEACAAYMGGRIPTFEEARSIYAYAEDLKKNGLMVNKLANNIPAVNGHLINNGVQETPPSAPQLPASTNSGGVDLFVDLAGANVGFTHWHPSAVTPTGGSQLAGQSSLGGVWEWTSTALEPHAGFEPMALYPGYTADFFDGKHNIVLGGSWATHPRIAGRTSFVNWYQRNYPYAWAGARLVMDA